MMKKYLSLIACCTLAVSLTAQAPAKKPAPAKGAAAKPKTQAPAPPATPARPPSIFNLDWDKTEYMFGNIPKGKPATATFKVTNTTSETLVIKDVKGGCYCTTTSFSKTPVAPGKTGTIKATYDAAVTGPFSKAVKVFTNFDTVPFLVILKGNVVDKKQ